MTPGEAAGRNFYPQQSTAFVGPSQSLWNIIEITGVLHLGSTKKEGVMHLSRSRKQNRLPKRFPVGTTYVVEGIGGADGHLQVFSRFVVLPGGERINLGAEFSGRAAPRRHRSPPSQGTRAARAATKRRTARSKKILPAVRKKIIAVPGTSRRSRR